MELSLNELKSLISQETTQPLAENGSLQIVVIDQGFVVVGYYHQSGNTITLTDAKTIRRWGTTHGLGQLAFNGPTAETVLDIEGTVATHLNAVIKVIQCNPSNW